MMWVCLSTKWLSHSGFGCCVWFCLSTKWFCCHTVVVGVGYTQWFSLPTKWFCVIFHIWETIINMGPSQLFSVGVTQLLWVLGIRSGSACPRSCSVLSSIYRKPLLIRGPHSCFPLVSHSGSGCWYYVVVLSVLGVRRGCVCPQSGYA